MEKLHPESSAAIAAIKKTTGENKKITFVSGNFNIVHPGHLRLLRFAAECGDFLVVGVLDDNIGHVVLPEILRLEAVKSNNWVDFAFILRETTANPQRRAY